jgi:transcription antitermination factor NusG
MGSAVASWFALWTRSRHEKSVRNQLGLRAIEVFLPLVSKWRRWRDRRKLVEFPLFPGYCFARFDRGDHLEVRKCPGVVEIVSFNGEPAPIPDHEVETIRTLVTSALPFDPCPFIREGDLVEVVHGPLRGAVGRLVGKGSKSHLVVSIELLNRSVRVAVDPADIRPTT